ncbi:MAG TPA: DNA topoisomerase, partial [Candidatus Saccharimonadales bacterium]|nr:DNA topoisomerase [Candidatus Saccharimonadales bacterium]
LKLRDEKIARQFLEDIKPAKFSVARLEQKPAQRSPSPPFTTSTLQQEAARRLGFSVRQTMTLAQKLYENGHITYMRTDSFNLSPIAINDAEAYLKKNHGQKYARPTRYKTKSASAQEAHEAIRPTSFSLLSAGNDAAQKRLYDLIWRRALASQMAPAAIERTEIDIAISTRPELLSAVGEVLSFDGFLKVYGGSKEDQILPALRQGDQLVLKSALAAEVFSRAPARYSEASLVRKLEELGIGRPSTYAPTISTIQDRGYIEKGDTEGEIRPAKQFKLEAGKISQQIQDTVIGADRGKLLPTYLADVVTDFLLKHFAAIMDYKFTAKAEAEFDDIAAGKTAWQAALEHFYSQFHPLVKQSEKADRAEAAQARQLGKDPKTGKIVVVRYGRYGPVLQLGEAGEDAPKDAQPIFAPLPEGARLEDISLEQALPMFKLPRLVGKTADGQEITANIGRFGPYVHVDKLFVSIKGQDPMAISEADARKLINERLERDRKKVIADFGKIKVLNGPYGPYVTDGKVNARVPKDQKAEELDEPASRKLLDEAPKKRPRRYRRTANKPS